MVIALSVVITELLNYLNFLSFILSIAHELYIADHETVGEIYYTIFKFLNPNIEITL